MTIIGEDRQSHMNFSILYFKFIHSLIYPFYYRINQSLFGTFCMLGPMIDRTQIQIRFHPTLKELTQGMNFSLISVGQMSLTLIVYRSVLHGSPVREFSCVLVAALGGGEILGTGGVGVARSFDWDSIKSQLCPNSQELLFSTAIGGPTCIAQQRWLLL